MNKALLVALALSVVVIVLLVFGRLFRALIGPTIRVAATASGPDFTNFTLIANDGSPYLLAQHRGQVILLVNTASKCGFTKQYDGLERLWQRYRERGLVIIGVPTNDFFAQEPGSDADIAAFCRVRHGVTFPLMQKITLRGPQAHALYRDLQQQDPLPGAVPWNFEKCLLGRDGRLRARISPRVEPEDPRVIALLDRLLAEDPAASPSRE